MMSLAELIRNSREMICSVVPFSPGIDLIIPFDLSNRNQTLTPEIFGDTALFSEYMDELLQQAGARYGIGGYLENRKVYARSRVFDALASGEEPRTLHLGVDIWGVAGTPVMAPLPGIVHSKGNHTEYGNYGATIILQHELEGISFFTLYGHLSARDLNVPEGSRVHAGEVFAHFGSPAENGYWPPHLHFQLMADMQGYSGDYPGVCAPSMSALYAANCPDPALLLPHFLLA